MEDGSIHVLVSDSLMSAPAAKTARLQRDVVDWFGFSPSATSLRHHAPTGAQYKEGVPSLDRPDFHVLYRHKLELRRFLRRDLGVSGLDIADETGRIIISLVDLSFRDAIQDQLTKAESQFVDFGVKPFPSEYQSLRFDPFSPRVGGPRIAFSSPSPYCTQGPTVQYQGAYGFLTTSHCTASRYSTGSRRFYEIDVGVGRQLGVEFAEPAVDGGENGFYSDAVFVRTDAGVELTGKMTLANSTDGTCVVQDGNDLVSIEPCDAMGYDYSVTGTAEVGVGMWVMKTGQRTGTTGGYVERVCEDLPSSSAEAGNAGAENLCQNVVIWGNTYGPPSRGILAWPGDSGAAVLLHPTPGWADGPLVGVLWGGPAPDYTRFYYSPWENIVAPQTLPDYSGTPQNGLALQVVTASDGPVSNATSSGSGNDDPGNDNNWCAEDPEDPPPGDTDIGIGDYRQTICP